ncbi:MAG: MarR family transcriptional regulator [Pseudomonadota bacterium]
MNEGTADGLGTQLRRLLELLDGELEQVYREDHAFYVPRFTPVMKALAGAGTLTIKDIAERSSVSHSAASQTVSKLEKHGLVELEPDADRRSRRVTLSAEGRRLLPWLSDRWAATTAAAAELDEELTSPLSALLRQAIDHLERRPFSDRIRAHEKREGGR